MDDGDLFTIVHCPAGMLIANLVVFLNMKDVDLHAFLHQIIRLTRIRCISLTIEAETTRSFIVMAWENEKDWRGARIYIFTFESQS